MIRLIAPEGKKLRDTITGAIYSEVICSEKKHGRFVVADSEADPTIKELDGVTLKDRIADLENAVESIAAKSKVNISLKAKAGTKEAHK